MAQRKLPVSVLELFSGVGGMRLALGYAGIEASFTAVDVSDYDSLVSWLAATVGGEDIGVVARSFAHLACVSEERGSLQSADDDVEQLQYKIIILGDGATGKTSIATRALPASDAHAHRMLSSLRVSRRGPTPLCSQASPMTALRSSTSRPSASTSS